MLGGASVVEAPAIAFEASMIAHVPTPLRTMRTPTGPPVSELDDATKGEALKNLVTAMSSANTTGELLKAVTGLRDVLSSRKQQPLQAVIDCGGAEALIRRLDDGSSGAVMYEAAWALTNILCGTSAQTKALIDAGIVDGLFAALQSQAVIERPDLCEQCMWALGNIVGEGVWFRDHLLDAGIIGVLGQLFCQMPGFTWQTQPRTKVLQTLTWLMSSLCHGTPPPSLDEVESAFDYFAQVLVGTDDVRMLSEALGGFSSLFECMGNCEAESATHIFNSVSASLAVGEEEMAEGLHPLAARLVSLTHRSGIPGGSSLTTVLVPAVRLLGHMVHSSIPDVANAAIDADAAQAFCRVVQDQKLPYEARQHAACGIRSIAAGGSELIQLLIDAGVWAALARGLLDPFGKVQDECVRAIVDMVNHGCQCLSWTDVKQAMGLLGKTLCKHMEEALQCMLLDATEAVFLQHGGELMKRPCKDNDKPGCGHHHALAVVAQESGVVESLEALRTSEHDVVRRKAANMLLCWFGNAKGAAELAGRCSAKKGDILRPSLSIRSSAGSPTKTRPPTGTSKFGA
mmetsp:Transcript_123484/g.349004  ORF Transcript_123484/g.349004 Transcript_123484/m.349004 type:complete len:571 (-) Transcript_123484:135-1847(-)